MCWLFSSIFHLKIVNCFCDSDFSNHKTDIILCIISSVAIILCCNGAIVSVRSTNIIRSFIVEWQICFYLIVNCCANYLLKSANTVCATRCLPINRNHIINSIWERVKTVTTATVGYSVGIHEPQLSRLNILHFMSKIYYLPYYEIKLWM